MRNEVVKNYSKGVVCRGLRGEFMSHEELFIRLRIQKTGGGGGAEMKTRLDYEWVDSEGARRYENWLAVYIASHTDTFEI
jgi:hypothetical protein